MNQYSQFLSTPSMMEALVNSSVSVADAKNRASEYAKMFSRNDEMMDWAGQGNQPSLLEKTFSGYAETPLLSTQYFNASVASYVSSFAGYMSVERDFEQPNGLFYWFDVLGVSNMRSVIPNLGPDNYQDIQAMGGFTTEVTPSTTSVKDYQVITGRKIIPGTVRVKISDSSASYELVDNGQGGLMAVANKISSSEINYLTGTIKFTLVANPASTGSITIIGKEDTTGTPCNTNGASNAHTNDKRVVAKMQQFGLSTVPDMLVAEYNIAALGALKKATQTDMATFLFTKLRELYTKVINYKLITTLEEGYTGDTMGAAQGFSLSKTAISGQFYDYRSRVDLFDAFLIDVEAALAQKAVKGVKITAFVAGAKASNQFQKGGMIGKFEKNTKISYINDLIGWYDGIPVLRSTDIDETCSLDTTDANYTDSVFYAIHKTDDGQMAPLARGIYMPLTDTPTVGNYNNPTQMAAGIYYQEGTKTMANELVQRVAFKSGI